MVILKTESQLKSFMTRKSTNNPDVEYGLLGNDYSVFLSGKKIIRCITTFVEYGHYSSTECEVIALYIPRVK